MILAWASPFNNQACLISEGKIGQKIVYNGSLGLRNIDVHVW